MKTESIWDNFTNLYSLSKTLRFELKSVGSDGKVLSEEQSAAMFKTILEDDRKIKEAYIALKPVMDKIHENVINDSLESKETKSIDFTAYFEEYQKGKERNIEPIEKALREKIGQTFEDTATDFAKKAGVDEKGKPILTKKGTNCLTEAGILKYLEKNIVKYVPSEKVKDYIYQEKGTNSKGKEEIVKSGYLATFKGFFGYFSGYNLNRENYYSKEDKSTAVPARIVQENLPKFCDNIIQFSYDKVFIDQKTKESKSIPSRKSEYLNAYQYLKNNGKITQIKDAETNSMIEASPIKEKIFNINYFVKCLTQTEIDEYNKVIGHYNLLINLYNQARKETDKDFRKLPPFKTLFKQIGSSKKNDLFFSLKYDTEEEQNKNESTSKVLSLHETLKLVSQAGEKYFKKYTSSEERFSIFNIIEWLQNQEDWDGVYWSKTALTKISNAYLANWYDIKDRIQQVFLEGNKDQKERLKSLASFDKKREEELKINDVVELSGLFEILDQDTNSGWSERFFKASIVEERNSLINETEPPSKNLIKLICEDLKDLAENFLKQSDAILKITEYKKEDKIKEIKDWLDTAKSLLWILKYFQVRPSKIKGSFINSELENLTNLVLNAEDADWFEWYDSIRNYLTRKPQDDAKKNKLKLNFGNGNLLGGWSDGEEKNKSAVLLKNGNKHFIGILTKRTIFDTQDEDNPVYKSNPSSNATGRLIVKNLAFKTLAGKGFVRDFGIKYSEITNKQEAIEKLQTFIKKNYIQKYPLLQEITKKKYSDKKIFDKEVQDTLLECYECDFTPIDWKKILKFVEEKSMYLFELYSKDFSENRGEKSKDSISNLQSFYWKHLFEEDSTIQLCGGGEIFFREKAIEIGTVHYANTPIFRRTDEKTASVFGHDIIKNKRFTKEKFHFHVPIKINYQAPVAGIREGRPNPSAFNSVQESVNSHFTQRDDIQFLGIDRGEKHLIYFSLIDKDGKIIEQNHLDSIHNKDYLKAINESADIRRKKQENWQQKGNIASLKDGYISLVIHEIIQKIKNNNGNYEPTFIVLEDLNAGFKRGRQKFEQQVYQKFELALAKKLNYLVDKKAIPGEIGSTTKALQLTPPVANFQDIENRKQIGVMLYTRANYTSVTDPATGWRKTIYLKKGSEEFIKEQILNKFTEIRFDGKDYYFQYNDSNGKEWTLWSGKNGKALERYKGKIGKDKNEYIIEAFDSKSYLDQLFKNFDKNKSLLQQINNDIELDKINEHTAWETLRFSIDTIQQIRNSGDTTKHQDDNFLLSPVRDEKGNHFDSRKSDESLPKDADANGAYNIARKGIIMYEHIKHCINAGIKKTSDFDLFISDEEWDLWTTNRSIWEKKLKTFASRKEKETEVKKDNQDKAPKPKSKK